MPIGEIGPAVDHIGSRGHFISPEHRCEATKRGALKGKSPTRLQKLSHRDQAAGWAAHRDDRPRLFCVAGRGAGTRPCVEIAGFSLHVATRCRAYDRYRLARLCRYVTRPARPDLTAKPAPVAPPTPSASPPSRLPCKSGWRLLFLSS